MNTELLDHIITICDKKIALKGLNVGVSFYAFFKNKNDNPELLFKVAKWWIKTNRLDHFEKAYKIKSLLLEIKNSKNS
ncbi:MAG: hypothetical protein KUG51_04300 [Urechidicola sp.]|nr:hypothetical protein [Urechidicola sp.]